MKFLYYLNITTKHKKGRIIYFIRPYQFYLLSNIFLLFCSSLTKIHNIFNIIVLVFVSNFLRNFSQIHTILLQFFHL